MLKCLNSRHSVESKIPPFNGNKRVHMAALSGLAKITFNGKNGPFALFTEWMHEVTTVNKGPVLMNLATAKRDGTVSNRTVVFQELKHNNFVFMTSSEGTKVTHIKENPNVALCFSFAYSIEGKSISRQIRVEGQAQPLSKEECKMYYNNEPIFCKIRSHICHQGEIINNWDDLKAQHDKLLQEVENGTNSLEMPDYQVAYEVVPSKMDFYYSTAGYIADRLVFKKIDNEKWDYNRIAA